MQNANKLSFKVNADHPCLAGHFPGNPVVPGVVILDELTEIILQLYNGYELSGFINVKFLQPLRAAQIVTVLIGEKMVVSDTSMKIKFSAAVNDALVAQGEVKFVKTT